MGAASPPAAAWARLAAPLCSAGPNVAPAWRYAPAALRSRASTPASPTRRTDMEELLAPFHPQLVHAPVALIIVAAAFELLGRALDLEWWRKAAFAMLVVGVLGAGAAVISGGGAGDAAEHQGVPEQPVDAHEEMAQLTLWLGIAAVVTRAIAGRTGRARPLVATLALLLHLTTAVTVGVAAHRGGRLVYEYGAKVKVDGKPVVTPKPGQKAEP